ncbi:ceramide kinase isoform X2 [Dendrobium catenatum]|uniref:ceramide kinase isoform X2 n=1 Tax=Dendrobium catenatum TaxID=906689 RepID=UPI0009F71AD5|nr:ceramide kinase isoform X2 [Dendrobium catenatum]
MSLILAPKFFLRIGAGAGISLLSTTSSSSRRGRLANYRRLSSGFEGLRSQLGFLLFQPRASTMDTSAPALSSTLFLDRVGEVVLSLNSTGLSWIPASIDPEETFCCQMMFHSEVETEIRFSDVYAVEFTGLGLINGHNSTEMYRFVVHGFQRGKNSTSPYVLSTYTFGHRDSHACRELFDQINACMKLQVGRPKNLLVFVHPQCGKGNGCKTWEVVAPLFSRAKVTTKVTVTQRAGHAYDILKSSTDRELRSFDGIIAVGGDGLFNEVLNGLLSSRHKAPYPPAPTRLNTTDVKDPLQLHVYEDSKNVRNSLTSHSDIFVETALKGEDPTSEQESFCSDQSTAVSFPNDWLRLGIIPAGSTDAIVISTTGVRDPITSALHIILGKKISLDVAQVVRWKTTPSSIDTPSVRYAASFAGYGFYGDVIKESEKYRWMGPSRYDFTGTKVFLEHRAYEAEIGFLEAKAVDADDETLVSGTHQTRLPRRNPTKRVCLTKCSVCVGPTKSSQTLTNGSSCSSDGHAEDSRWLRSKGRFLSVGAAVISCRNERAPDGLVVDAHLSDGFLHLILVKDCPRPFYLWHLTKLTRRGSNPLDFSFVEHHKTQAFTFVANHDSSVWNLDGELFQACQVTVRACHGLINLFAAGPEA